MPTKAEIITHRLINKERVKRGRGWAKWDPYMYKLAKRLARQMAREGHIFHSDNPALKGGECVAGGKGNHSPRDFLKSWMTSPGHRSWLLTPPVKFAAVGIATSKKGTYAAWSFHDGDLFYLIARLIRRIFKH